MAGEKMRVYKAHCLVVPFPTQGHINPMLQFSKRLVNEGITVTLAPTYFMFKGSMQGILSNSIAIEPISDGYDEFSGLTGAESNEAYLASYRRVGTQTLEKVIKKLEGLGCPVDCIIYDSFLPWILDIAKKFGMVGVAFFTQSCAVGNIFYHVYKGNLKLPLVEPIFSLPGLPSLEPSDMPSFIYAWDSYPAFLEMLVNQYSNVEEADWILYNTFHELEQEEADWVMKLCSLKTVGPTIPSMYLDKRLKRDTEYGLSMYIPKTDICMKWLNDQPDHSTVYVSFGSLVQLEALQMEEIAIALKESNYHFLWVVRTSEEPKLPIDFVHDTVDKGLVVSWCPQLDVLSHGAIGCFVTHCGWNSTLEALSLGVPMVAMPQWADQTTNSKYVMDVWKMGVRAKADEKGIVRGEIVKDCLREVMEGERGMEIRNNAIKWKELARKAADEGGSSDRNIYEFVSKLAHS